MAKIQIVCFGNHSGYSQAAQDLILALHKSDKGYDVCVKYIQAKNIPQTGMTKERVALFQSLSQKQATEDHITVYLCLPTSQYHVKATRRSIGYAMFETFEPPNEGAMNWITRLNQNDAIVCPSLFNYKIFAHEKLTKPIFHIPCAYDRELYHKQIEPLEKRDRFTFLFFGTWKQRKGYPALLEAFLREFSHGDGVQLVIKTDKPQDAQDSLNKIRKNLGLEKKDIAPILFERRVFDDVTLPRFFKSADCLIAPTLGEGFGLPGLQCMALGVPVAITDYSGCQDYANDQTCTLIKPSGFVLYPCLDNLPQYHHRKWALVTESEVRRVMRHVLSNSVEIKAKAEQAQTFVEKEFSYERTEQRFSDMLRTTFNV